MPQDANRPFTIRRAEKTDTATILYFVRALAEYERLADKVSATEETIAASLFGPRTYGECLLAEADGTPAGFALYFHNFSTFTGKPGLYLEDLFVKPEFRRWGIGQAFFRALARIALERDCARFEWAVLDWNEPAIKFYRRLGAEPMSDWIVQRLTRDKIERLANE